jgi:hypothetical protein
MTPEPMTSLIFRLAERYSIRQLAGIDSLIKAGVPMPTAKDDLYRQFTSSQYSPGQAAVTLAENLREVALEEAFQPMALILDIFA